MTACGHTLKAIAPDACSICIRPVVARSPSPAHSYRCVTRASSRLAFSQARIERVRRQYLDGLEFERRPTTRQNRKVTMHTAYDPTKITTSTRIAKLLERVSYFESMAAPPPWALVELDAIKFALELCRDRYPTEHARALGQHRK